MVNQINKENIDIINKEERPTDRITKEVKCFKCDNSFFVKFVKATAGFSKKNNWGYWTENEENDDKYICSPCLRKMYFQDHLNFRQQVPSAKKRHSLKTYMAINLI
jgi:hypothetical protein